jgi:hypothetical protein
MVFTLSSPSPLCAKKPPIIVRHQAYNLIQPQLQRFHIVAVLQDMEEQFDLLARSVLVDQMVSPLTTPTT